MKTYDYIIAGAGAAGLQLAWFMANDPFFRQKQILLIEKEPKNKNDRTWCFWEQGTGPFEEIVFRVWEQAYFGSKGYSNSFSLAPYAYKMIQAIDFYTYILDFLKQQANIHIRYEEVKDIQETDTKVRVNTSKGYYTGNKLFSSIFDPQEIQIQKKHPVLSQHFIGWFLKTEDPVFNPGEIAFMDFDIPQRGNTRFMYLLPFSKHEALLEYTLFSEKLLTDEEYEKGIEDYLQEKNIRSYTVTAKEKGSIPMTSFNFSKKTTQHHMPIGTAGGWTKASTGFTFKNTTEKTKQLTEFLKHNTDLRKFNTPSRFSFYDRILLDILFRKNELGSMIFSKLFRKNKPQTILRFLEEKTSFTQELSIMWSVADRNFTGTFFRCLVPRSIKKYDS
ncbi:lycopene cyclase family protein [Ascidiimonas aurantiaca]|uniref:lycopene cyclase family protein n=1 Tax=Ascidiimonas aurantiaca TaxID=1685432 RepID=UPI0030EBC071